MDKYTIDLDQVLNDFEYLELTDHHTRNVSNESNNNSTLGSSPIITKHSIHNVFHSLNEYLTTNINQKNEQKQVVESDENLENIDNTSINKAGISKDKEQVQECLTTIVTSPNVSQDKRLLENEDLSNNSSYCASPLISEETNKDVNSTDNKIYLKDEHEEVGTSNITVHSVNEITSKPYTDFEETDELGVSSDIKSDINLEENRELDDHAEQRPSKTTDDFVSNNTEETNSKTLIKNDVGQENIEEYVIEPSISLDLLELKHENPNCVFEEDTDSQKNILSEKIQSERSDLYGTNNVVTDQVIESQASNNCEQPKNKTKIVGFSTDIDIEEQEFNELLNNFEQEVTENVDSSLMNTEILVEGKETNFESKIAKESSTINDVNIDQEMDGSDLSKCLNEHNNTMQIRENVIETSEQIKVEDASNVQIEDENLNNNQESIDMSEKCDVSIQNKCMSPLKKNYSQDSLTRPQNLLLSNEVKENGSNSGRKIDLIGNPGSTPYNNVYINETIESKDGAAESKENDSDYSTSASPTFSDCSGDSTSTASTVSVDDENKEKESNLENLNNTFQNFPEDKNAAKFNNVKDDIQTNVESNNDTTNTPAVTSEENSNNTTESGGGEGGGTSGGGGDTMTGHNFLDKSWLGKEAPLWIPDSDALTCLHCDMKFTVLKRRHHCRACGLVLCSKCCNLKFRLEYLDTEARVCNKCFEVLNKDSSSSSSSSHNSPESVSPLQQVGQALTNPPTVMVPVGVLKRKGSNKKSNKSVMFCDGIAPGSDLTSLDQDFNYNNESKSEAVTKDSDPPKEKLPNTILSNVKCTRNQPKIDHDTGCYIPKSESDLPPTISINKSDVLYSECSNSPSVVEMLKNESLTFAINQNLFVHVKIINMSCCISKQAWCFCTEGLINVGSDEIVYLLEYIEDESFIPKDLFFHIYSVYSEAEKGSSIKELGLSLHRTSTFLDSKNHAGFVYIKPSFQCLDNVIKPKESFLIGILIHRWETPWAKLFPLRLILRLGAEYRYYPSPIISTRYRESVFVEIGHTIINLLADFRNFTYTLPQIRGLTIHMEDKKTTITIPKNRYDQVIKSINNSSEYILAFGGNFSPEADSHLVCIQNTQGHENSYSTHAINIHNKPRILTGASFIVFNGSLKSSSGLTAKSTIVEDGLMIQITSEHMEKIREDLRNLKDHTIACGCVNVTSDESVNIIWGENDTNFNVGVKSPVDLADMQGVPSIRVHNGKDYFCNNGSKLIRWTEVFILQNGEENSKSQDPVDISKISESIAKACCNALLKYLDLLVSNSCQKIGIRATLHVENVSYLAGSNGSKLAPIYMRSLDNELIPVLHKITTNNLGDSVIELELIFRILNS